MKKFLYLFLAATLAWGMTGCKQDDPVNPDPDPQPEPEPLPTAFVKKHLLEEFTGQDCGYCPMGMDSVHAFVGDDPNWIVVLHHYGYQKDHFSVAGSKKITSKMGVSGAPTVTINRTSAKTSDGKQTCFHPAYLPEMSKAQFDDSTYVGLTIANTYDAATRSINVKVHGIVTNEDCPSLKLTVLIKESGMIDYQQDYYGSYEGWQEFRHANAVRAFLSDPLGDLLDVDRAVSDQPEPLSFNQEYDLQLDAAWVPENCMVVAIVTEDFKPVIQVEQQPVVEGSKGGADILHGGVTPVAVPDYYPEPGADISPNSFNENNPITITEMYAYRQTLSGIALWQLQGYNSSLTFTISKMTCVPLVNLYLFTSSDATTIPVGTYEFTDTYEPGTAVAGYRDDEHIEINGSMLYFTSLSYLQQNYLVPGAQWLIASGTLTVTDEGWNLAGQARNGTEILLQGSAIQIQKLSAPAKLRRL